jgi:hypothetical protein
VTALCAIGFYSTLVRRMPLVYLVGVGQAIELPQEREPEMKRAKVYITAVWVDCPHCGEAISGEGGSQMWDTTRLDGAVVACFGCGKESILPVSAKATARFPK